MYIDLNYYQYYEKQCETRAQLLTNIQKNEFQSKIETIKKKKLYNNLIYLIINIYSVLTDMACHSGTIELINLMFKIIQIKQHLISKF